MDTIIDLAESALVLALVLASTAVVVIGGIRICWGLFSELMDEIKEKMDK